MCPCSLRAWGWLVIVEEPRTCVGPRQHQLHPASQLSSLLFIHRSDHHRYQAHNHHRNQLITHLQDRLPGRHFSPLPNRPIAPHPFLLLSPASSPHSSLFAVRRSSRTHTLLQDPVVCHRRSLLLNQLRRPLNPLLSLRSTPHRIHRILPLEARRHSRHRVLYRSQVCIQ